MRQLGEDISDPIAENLKGTLDSPGGDGNPNSRAEIGGGKRARQTIGGKSQLWSSQPNRWSGSGGGSANGSSGGRKPRGLVSQNKLNKHWQITTFQKGTLQANSDPRNGEDLHLEWEAKRNGKGAQFRVKKVDGHTKASEVLADFSADFVKLYVHFSYYSLPCLFALLTVLQHCENQIGLEFHGTKHTYGYLAITNKKDIEEVRGALTSELERKKVHQVDE